MPTMVTIGGSSVDMDDPCAMLSALRKAEIAITLGESVSMTRFGEDEVRFSAANSTALARLIDRYDRLCAQRGGRRRRYASTLRFVR